MKQIIRIVRLTWKFWPYYLSTGALILLISLLNLANPVLNKFVVDNIVGNIQNHNSNFLPIGILLGLILLSDVAITLFSNFQGYLGDRLGAKLNTFLTSKFYSHLLKLEIEYFDNEISGKIMNKLQRGIENISSFINSMLNNFLPYFLTALFTIIFLAFYSWEIALLLAALFPFYILISDKSNKVWGEKQNQINKIQDNAFGRVLETISGIRIVKSFIREHLEHTSFINKRKDIEKLAKIQSIVYHRFDVYRRLILNIILFLIYAYIIYYTYTGKYTIGEMTLLLQLVTQARFPLFAMSFILSQIQSAQSGSKDFFEVLSQEIKIKDKTNATILKSIKGNVRFENISFTYEKDSVDNSKNILKNINFEVQSGEKLAIVGESGEGKSTLTNLLLRFYEPQVGKMFIDNTDISSITQESLHHSIAIVMQESLLFSGTIKDNIKYGNFNATDDEIISAAKAANAHDFISKFSNGYDTEIGEKGIKLSGGQKQRISIARAILKNAPILILDEATSSLDSKAEHEVQIALEQLMQGKTTLIIAHRLSTIKDVDKIIVLKGGTIAEQGSPKELANKEGGIYAELLQLQSTSTPGKKTDIRLKKMDLV